MFLPLLYLPVNCWPSPTDDGSMDVNIEYELVSEDPSIQLKNIIISIPLPSTAYPTSVTAAPGTSYTLDDASHSLNWLIQSIHPEENEESKNGVLEFSVPGDDVGAFFPVTVDFVAQRGLCGVQVSKVSSVDGGSDLAYTQEVLLNTEEFAVV